MYKKHQKFNPYIIRIRRRGNIHNAIFEIVVMMKKSRRQGAVIQRLGHYNPNLKARLLFINIFQLVKWVNRGAIVHNSVKRRLIKFIGLYKYYGR